DYASFYFVVPVATMGGIVLDAFASWRQLRGKGGKGAVLLAMLALFAWLTLTGERQALALNKPFRILDWDKPEPAELIPELGRAIHERFSEGTTVICNFLPFYGPQLPYYAQRTMLNCILSADDWIQATKGPQNGPVGGVIWLGQPNAKEVLKALPAGSREEVNVRG